MSDHPVATESGTEAPATSDSLRPLTIPPDEPGPGPAIGRPATGLGTLMDENRRLRSALASVLSHAASGDHPGNPIADVLADLFESEIVAHMVMCAAYAPGLVATPGELYAWAAAAINPAEFAHTYVDPAIDAIRDAAIEYFSPTSSPASAQA